MSEHHGGTWDARGNPGGWWPGAMPQDQQVALQHHQHMMHQQQLAQQQQQQAPQQPPPNMQQQSNLQQQQNNIQQQQNNLQQQQQQVPQQTQQQQMHVTSTAANMHQQQLFSYKMASSFQNPATTQISNVSSTSPIGAAGIRGYDYRLGGNMTGGNPTMQGPAPGAQWWYPSAMDNTMQNSMQQNPMQSMTSVHTPPPVSQAQQQSQLNQQQAEVQARQQAEAQRHHQEAQRHHQEVQQRQEAHHQAVAEAQARHQQQQNHHQIQQNHHQLQQQNHQNHHPQNQLHQQLQHLQQQQQPPIPTKGRMPRGKADAKPRGRMTAYAFFVQTCREEHKKKHPEENVVFAEFSKKCAERWKTMLDKEKKRFHEMAEKDKKRYDAEMQNYTPPKGEKQRGKKRKQMKDPNAPKRSLSAFFWFSNDERGKVKAENPEFGVGDIAKELGRRWAEADAEVKAKYVAMAEKDKARYEKEMTAYKKDGAVQHTQETVPEAAEDEEEEEEEVEEDEDD